MTWEQTAMALMKEVDRLQKENDRLNVLISPAAEGGGESKSIVRHEMTAEETAEAAEIIRRAWNGIDTKSAWEELLDEASNRALKTVWFNPAGGGAANGGESKIPTCPLCEKKMDARKVFNSEDNLNWVIGVCDSCNVHSPLLYQIDPQKALEAAIMGLHGMAKEFPNPMWKTREDYLAATISEINEILGKQ